MDLKSSHDEFFKLLFREVKNAASYFQNTFPQELLTKTDFTTLKLEDGTFVDEKLKEKFSDILYSAKIQGKTGYIYILLDHKSHPDKYVALQLLKYRISIWERYLDNCKTRGNLPFVLQIGMHLLKNIYSEDLPDKLENIFQLFQKIEDEKQGLKWLQAAMKYLGSSSDEKTIDKLEKVLENTEIKGAKKIMATFAEKLEKKGYDKGLLKGKSLAKLQIQRANRKSKLRTAIRLKEEGSELAFIAKITELDIKYLETFFRKIGRC
ncbi:MAG: Rpn family recombination-promoting nuclease/putative transposase [Spirochaetota bacterium]